MVQISKNEAFVVLSSSTQIKLKKQFCNLQHLAENDFLSYRVVQGEKGS